MPDYKNQIVKDIEIILVENDTYSAEVIDKIVLMLNDYDITKACTELVAYDNVNERILKRYCACLYVDGKSEKTIYQYRRTIERFVQFVQKTLPEIDVYDIRMYLASEKERGISDRTAENTRANLSAFFQWMTSEEIIKKNPCLNIKPIKCKDEIRLPFSSVELDLLRGACRNNKERAIIEMLVTSGVRVNELSNMDVNDINCSDLSVHVRFGKGAKERVTFINDVAKTYLQRYIVGRKDQNIALICNRLGDRIKTGGIRHILNNIGRRAGVENVHPHRFRRTFATTLASRGMAIQEIQKLLGHSNLNTTMEYVVTNDSILKGSYEKYIA